MYTLACVLLAASSAHAAMKFSKNGVDYSITRTNNGKEVPVELGPSLGMNSKGPAHVKNSVNRRNSVQVTGNWCGMSNIDPPSGATWTSVYGEWIVPEITLRSGQTDADSPSIAQWVGIDGDDSCASGLIQGGTVSQILSDGSQQNYAWYEFVPDALTSIDLTVNIGDTMAGNVTVTSTTSGVVEVINYSSGEAVAVTITNGPGSLCGGSAEWILEDLSSGGGFVPLAEFPSGAFYDASSGASNGEEINAAGADYVDLYQNGVYLCEGSYDSTNNLVDFDSTA